MNRIVERKAGASAINQVTSPEVCYWFISCFLRAHEGTWLWDGSKNAKGEMRDSLPTRQCYKISKDKDDSCIFHAFSTLFGKGGAVLFPCSKAFVAPTTSGCSSDISAVFQGPHAPVPHLKLVSSSFPQAAPTMAQH